MNWRPVCFNYNIIVPAQPWPKVPKYYSIKYFFLIKKTNILNYKLGWWWAHDWGRRGGTRSRTSCDGGFVGLLGLWVCGFAGFAVMVVCGWLSVDCSGGFALCNGFLIFFFFSFYVALNTVKYFSDYFPKCKQTQKKQTFSCKSFAFANILRWRIFYVETNGAFKLHFKSLINWL